MTPNIRPGTSADLPAVLTLNQQNRPAVNGLTRVQLSAMVANCACFRVVEREKALAGFVLTFLPAADYASENLHWFNQHYRDFLYLDRIAIATFAQRQGCGTMLYNEIENYCRQQQIGNIALEVNLRPRNQSSLSFHEKLSFSEVGRQETDGGNKIVSLMIKAVT